MKNSSRRLMTTTGLIVIIHPTVSRQVPATRGRTKLTSHRLRNQPDSDLYRAQTSVVPPYSRHPLNPHPLGHRFSLRAWDMRGYGIREVTRVWVKRVSNVSASLPPRVLAALPIMASLSTRPACFKLYRHSSCLTADGAHFPFPWTERVN